MVRSKDNFLVQREMEYLNEMKKDNLYRFLLVYKIEDETKKDIQNRQGDDIRKR